MTELQIFENPEFGEIRTYIEPDGTVLFCGSDVAKALGYARPNEAVADHSKGTVKRRTLTKGGKQELNFIPEGDVYRLAASSKLPGADKFESWIFDVILPTIRKTGSYTTQENPQVAPLKDFIESVGIAAEILRVNEVSKITMLKKAFELKGQPTGFLPDYVEGREKRAATTLLKRNQAPFNTRKFNILMESAGLLEHKERPSRSKGSKLFWSLTKSGMEFGENLVSESNPRETQPLYYADLFPKLLEILSEKGK